MRLEYIAEPCHNFSIMSRLVIPSDPLDGREKMVMGNYAADNTGSLHIVDTETLEGESYPFPDDAGAWALNYIQERGELLIGTCDHLGYLHCFDMKRRVFTGSWRVDGESYLWRFARAADGCVYAGTYPGAKLIRFDPVKREMTDLGLVGDSTENHYTTPLFATDDGNIVVYAAHALPQVYLYDVRAREFRQVGQNGDILRDARDGFIMIERDGKLCFLSQKDFSILEGPIDRANENEVKAVKTPAVRKYLDYLLHPKKLPDLPLGIRGEKTACGALIGAKGQEVYRVENGETRFARIPGQAPSTSIMTIMGVGDTLWGSCENGQTIFSYRPENGAYWNSNCVCNEGGEVYGIAPVDGRLYLTAYAGGDHVVYDPSLPWDQRGNVNPKTLRTVGPDLIRPNSRSVYGYDGGVWTGWYAKYGVRGGGISRIDPKTDEVKSWKGPVDGQSVEYIAAGDQGVYVVTSGVGNGLETLRCAPHLMRLDGECRTLADYVFDEGAFLSRVAVRDGIVYVTCYKADDKRSTLCAFDEETLVLLHTVALGGEDHAVTDLLLLPGRVLLFAEHEAMLYSLPDAKLLDVCPLPGAVFTSTQMENGTVYCTCRRALYEIKMT